jgi:hypothetical protein
VTLFQPLYYRVLYAVKLFQHYEVVRFEVIIRRATGEKTRVFLKILGQRVQGRLPRGTNPALTKSEQHRRV